jgi:FtsP/CotA-like multicopper oxidase with cupredoxin domain
MLFLRVTEENMSRVVAVVAVCSLGSVVAPSPLPSLAPIKVHQKSVGATESPNIDVPICATKICGMKDGKYVTHNSQCEAERAGGKRIKFGICNATQTAAQSVIAQVSTAIVPAPTSVSRVAGEPLRQPPICSAIGAGSSELNFPFCRVAPLADQPDQHEATLSLSATTSPTHIGGYRFETINYNGAYLAPIVELKPGDSLRVRLVNALAPADGADAGHGSALHGQNDQSTNLHTHGLIVSPKNSRSDPRQNGDNIFVSLDRGQSLDYSIQIPLSLPASLLDGKSGIIPHPSGLYWYHSHLHGISAAQVAGGMSGVLSIGARDANLVATKEAETAALRARTDTAYLMLRDIQIRSEINPTAADGQSPAVWRRDIDSKLCQPADGVVSPPIEQRDGYCQSPADKSQIWLFTINGQRFPTIRIPSGRNKLLRLANLSASATYVVSLRDSSGNAVPFELISVDGVVPGVPTDGSAQPGDHPGATKITTLLMTPAARAEIFVKNDKGDPSERRLVLRTDGKDTSATGTTDGDPWPQIKLANVILEGAPVAVASTALIGLNEYAAKESPPAPTAAGTAAAVSLLPGCVRDIRRADLEHRRIMFAGSGPFSMTTDLVHPKDRTKLQPYDQFVADPSPDVQLELFSFNDYLKPDHTVDWDATEGRPRHTCVQLSNGHHQLWELNNPTTEMHNFHLHQTKFRLATERDLKDYGIDPSSVTLKSGFQIKASVAAPVASRDLWNDTLPVFPTNPLTPPVFIVINFDAREQLGRYVYHCHILEHEDQGLMAPIEVIP